MNFLPPDMNISIPDPYSRSSTVQKIHGIGRQMFTRSPIAVDRSSVAKAPRKKRKIWSKEVSIDIRHTETLLLPSNTLRVPFLVLYSGGLGSVGISKRGMQLKDELDCCSRESKQGKPLLPQNRKAVP